MTKFHVDVLTNPQEWSTGNVAPRSMDSLALDSLSTTTESDLTLGSSGVLVCSCTAGAVVMLRLLRWSPLLSIFSWSAANETLPDSDGSRGISEFPQVAPELKDDELVKLAVLAPAMSYQDARFLIHIYRARLQAMTDNTKAFKKEMKNAVSAADEASLRPTAATLMLKAHMESNTRKSLKLLAVGPLLQTRLWLSHLSPAARECLMVRIFVRKTQGTRQPSPVLLPMVLNNLGVMHHRLGKHALSLAYLSSAQDAFDQLILASKGERFFLKTHRVCSAVGES